MSKRRSIFPSVCLAVILGLGIQLVIAAAVAWIAGTSAQMMRSDQSFQALQFLVDGTPVIQTYTRGGNAYLYVESYRTLEGTPIESDARNVGCQQHRLRDRHVQRLYHFVGRGANVLSASLPAASHQSTGTSCTAARRTVVAISSVSTVSRNGVSATSVARAPRSDLPNGDDRFPVAGDKISRGITNSLGLWLGRIPYARLPDKDSPELPYWKVCLLSRNRLLEVDLRQRSVRRPCWNATGWFRSATYA